MVWANNVESSSCKAQGWGWRDASDMRSGTSLPESARHYIYGSHRSVTLYIVIAQVRNQESSLLEAASFHEASQGYTRAGFAASSVAFPFPVDAVQHQKCSLNLGDLKTGKFGREC
ncbi:hypothetical protein M8818_002527 [Zalaria obscura]|uniref:Uncharacterized protein n=1 Tax=Zalaria obscura TaxID=2024903 RepID=A0ACC3SJ90_9PEZI